MNENFEATITENGDFDPSSNNVYQSNSSGEILGTNMVCINPKGGERGMAFSGDPTSSQHIFAGYSTFDPDKLDKGCGVVHHPNDPTIYVYFKDNGIEVNVGTADKPQANGAITFFINGAEVFSITESVATFSVPIAAPAGSKVANKDIAVVGGKTTGNQATQTITTSGQ